MYDRLSCLPNSRLETRYVYTVAPAVTGSVSIGNDLFLGQGSAFCLGKCGTIRKGRGFFLVYCTRRSNLLC